MEHGIVLSMNEYKLGNSRLDKAARYIAKSLIEDAANEKGRAIKIHDVDFNGDAEKHGYKNTAEWAEKLFGWNKSKTSRYIRIVDRFHDGTNAVEIDENGKPVLPTDENGADIWGAYTVSQMIELLKATDEQLKRINNKMSVRDIRDFIKDDNGYIDIPDGEGNEGENNDPDNEGAGNDPAPDNVKHYTDITVLMSVVKQAAIHGDRIVIEPVITPMGNAWAVTYN